MFDPTPQGGRYPADGLQKVLVVLIGVSLYQCFMVSDTVPELLEIRKTLMKSLPR